MHRKSIWAAFVVGLLAGFTLTSLVAQSAEDRSDEIVEQFFKPMAWFVSQVTANYVEETDLNDLLTGAYQGMMWKLDRYCNYYPPDAFKEFQDDTRGEFGGLGMEIYFDPVKKVVVVAHPIPGTPAFRQGVLAEDMVYEVQQEGSDEVIKTEGFDDIHDALRVLRGDVGTRVTISVLRGEGEDAQRKKITIKREIIKIPSVRGAQRLGKDGDIGYVYIASFHEQLVGDLVSELEKLRAEGVKGFILDLRFNPGGLLDAALSVSDFFLDEGVIVSTKGRNSPLRVYRAHRKQIFRDVPLVVLVNKGSASAAEIVTAALRDNGRAVVVGEPTFGKASVQTILENPTRADAVKITTARYYTPSGDLIEGKGVDPDIAVDLDEEQLVALMEHLSTALGYSNDDDDETESEPEASSVPDGGTEAASPDDQGEQSEEEFQDVQLEKAVSVLAEMIEGNWPVPQAPVAAAAEAPPVAVAN